MKLHSTEETSPTLFNAIRAYLFPPIEIRLDSSPEISPVLQGARESILRLLMHVAMVFGAILYVTALSVNDVSLYLFAAYSALLLSSIYLALSPNLSYLKRMWCGALMLLALSITSVVSSGLSDDSRLYFLAFVMFVVIFHGTMVGASAIGIGAVALFLIGHLSISGVISFESNVFDHSELTYSHLLATISDWIFVCIFLTIAISILIRAMQLAWRRERSSFNAVQRQSEALEAALERERSARQQLQEKSTELNAALQRERETLKTVKEQSQALESSLDRETQLAEALKVSLERERDLSDMRSRIIATISHEFRTPLTIISNSLGLLNKYAAQLSADKRDRHIATIGASTEHLRALIEDVETVGKRNTIINMVIPERIPINEFCVTLIQHLITNTQKSDLIEIAPLPRFTTDTIITDRIAVHNILHQLVDNAIKFSAAPVTLTFSNDSRFLQIEVQDQGIGIDPKEHAQIFDLLERGTNAENISGLGIGLYVAQQVTELLEGTLAVTSAGLEQGSVFTLRVPLVTTGKVPTAVLT